MSKHFIENEREKLIELLKDSLVLSERIYECRDDIDDDDYVKISRSVVGIEGKALSLFLCGDDDARNLLLPEPLRRKFYEESSDEIFKITRFLNDVDGMLNVIV